MAKDFKKQRQATERTTVPRFAIPQVDPEAPKQQPAVTVEATQPPTPAPAVAPEPVADAPAHEELTEQPAGPAHLNLTVVDSSEAPQSRGTQMRPSRHKQMRDLAYIVDRKFWMILDDALELYVTKNYGKQYKRK